MSAIPCASVSLKTMADGTLRISFDIEPMHAQDAFRLFAAPGTPAAIAAIQVGYAAATGDKAATVEKPKGGPLAIEAAAMCRNPEYLRYAGLDSAEDAAADMRAALSIVSRSEIDASERVKADFIAYFRGPFMKHMMARGIVA